MDVNTDQKVRVFPSYTAVKPLFILPFSYNFCFRIPVLGYGFGGGAGALSMDTGESLNRLT